MIPDSYYNLIAIILLFAILAFILATVKTGMLLWRLTKGGSSIYPTKGSTPLGLLFGEKILSQTKIRPYFQTSKAWGIPFFIAFRPFQDMTITEKCFIFTKAHWYYGWMVKWIGACRNN